MTMTAKQYATKSEFPGLWLPFFWRVDEGARVRHFNETLPPPKACMAAALTMAPNGILDWTGRRVWLCVDLINAGLIERVLMLEIAAALKTAGADVRIVFSPPEGQAKSAPQVAMRYLLEQYASTFPVESCFTVTEGDVVGWALALAWQDVPGVILSMPADSGLQKPSDVPALPGRHEVGLGHYLRARYGLALRPLRPPITDDRAATAPIVIALPDASDPRTAIRTAAHLRRAIDEVYPLPTDRVQTVFVGPTGLDLATTPGLGLLTSDPRIDWVDQRGMMLPDLVELLADRAGGITGTGAAVQLGLTLGVPAHVVTRGKWWRKWFTAHYPNASWETVL